jgi:hypothetical protein
MTSWSYILLEELDHRYHEFINVYTVDALYTPCHYLVVHHFDQGTLSGKWSSI